jgi:hypothetical protein
MKKRRSRWEDNPDRYLWNNHGWWWMKYRPFDPLLIQKNKHVNLKTKDLNEARVRRDAIVADWNRKEVA